MSLIQISDPAVVFVFVFPTLPNIGTPIVDRLKRTRVFLSHAVDESRPLRNQL